MPRKKSSPASQPVSPPAAAAKPPPVAPAASSAPVKKSDHSSNYNAKEAVEKLRSQKSKAGLLAFTKGETRVTVTKAIPAAMNRL